MFSDCVLGFAQMLHVGLKQYYVPQHDPESNVDHLRGNEQLTFRIIYPGGPVTRIASLIHSYRNCVDFLWALFQVGGRTDGSVYFFVYRYDTDNCGPLDAARKMQWKMVLPWCIAYPLLKVFVHNRHEKDAQVTNRACMYYLDIPVLSPDERSLDSLRVLKLQEASRQNSRSVRARIERKTPAEYCIKFTPYDNSSYQGRDLVNCDSLAYIFKSLRVLLDNDQVKRRTLPRCKWNSADVAALRSFFSDCFSFILNFENTITWFGKTFEVLRANIFFMKKAWTSYVCVVV